MAEPTRYKCDHCRQTIKGNKLSWLDNSGRWHPLTTAIDNSRVPSCVSTDELRRFQQTVGVNFYEGTFEQYENRFKHVFGGKR